MSFFPMSIYDGQHVFVTISVFLSALLTAAIHCLFVAVDMWSAGVIFLSLLSARYPFFRTNSDMVCLGQIISVLGLEKVRLAASTYGQCSLTCLLSALPLTYAHTSVLNSHCLLTGHHFVVAHACTQCSFMPAFDDISYVCAHCSLTHLRSVLACCFLHWRRKHFLVVISTFIKLM